MKRAMRDQIHKDYREILSSEAGKRIFGGIFFVSRVNGVGLETEYMQGRRDMGVTIANTIREIDPRLIAECEIAYRDMKRSYENGHNGNGDGNSEYPDSGNY